MKYYLIIVWDDLEPEVFGPYTTETERDKIALEYRKLYDDKHGYYPAETDAEGGLKVGVHSGQFLAGLDDPEG